MVISAKQLLTLRYKHCVFNERDQELKTHLNATIGLAWLWINLCHCEKPQKVELFNKSNFTAYRNINLMCITNGG